MKELRKAIRGLKLSRNLRTPESDHLEIYILCSVLQRMLENGEIKRTECEVCGKTVEDIDKHMKTHLGQFACERCNVFFTARARLKEHQVDAHGRDGAFLHRCDVCNKSCFSKVKYNAHRAATHG